MTKFIRCHNPNCELKYNCIRATIEKENSVCIQPGEYEDGSQFCNYFLNPLKAQKFLNVEKNDRREEGEIKP